MSEYDEDDVAQGKVTLLFAAILGLGVFLVTRSIGWGLISFVVFCFVIREF